MKHFVWVIVLVCLCLPTTVWTQTVDGATPKKRHVKEAATPSLMQRNANTTPTVITNDSIPMTVVVQNNEGITAPTHSPSKALYLSFIPGGGQIYNHQAWKVPIIYGLIGGLSYWSYSSYGKMRDFREEYLLRVNGGEPQMEGYENYPDASIYNLYVSNNQYFQLGIVLTVLTYGLNLLDAYVYGHLFDFQIDNDLSLSVRPSLMPCSATTTTLSPTMAVSLSF